jgi:hypothetical protein
MKSGTGAPDENSSLGAAVCGAMAAVGGATLGGAAVRCDTLGVMTTGELATGAADAKGIAEPGPSGFALSGGPAGCGLVEKTASSAAAGNEVDGEAMSSPAGGTDVRSTAGCASDLAADLEIGIGEFDEESARKFCSPLALYFGSDFLLAADSFCRSSVSELDMDEASFTPKLEGIPNKDEIPGAARVAAAVAELRIALKRIGIPHVAASVALHAPMCPERSALKK